MLIAVSQVSYIILLLHKIASFSQIYEKVGAPHGSGVLLLAASEPLIMPDIMELREELCITAPTLALCPGAAWALRDGGEPIDSRSPGCSN